MLWGARCILERTPTILTCIDSCEVLVIQFSEYPTYVCLIYAEGLITDARLDIWRQPTQFNNVNYTIIANPITVEVDVGYDHDDGHGDSREHGGCLCHHHGRHCMLCHGVGGRVAPMIWPFPQYWPSVSFCKLTISCACCCIINVFDPN